MRVCFVTNFITPYRKTFFEKLCANSCHDWLVLRGKVGEETGRPDYKGSIAVPTKEVENIERGWGPFTLRFQKGALSSVRSHNPDTLILLGMAGNVSNWLMIMWARLTGRRVLIWASGWEPQRAGSMSLWIKKRLMRTYFGMAHKCLLYSTKGMRYLESTGVCRKNLEICFNGIEIDNMVANEKQILIEANAIRDREIQPNDFVFLYVGGLLKEKRIELLLDAFSSIQQSTPSARLWVVGDGPDGAHIKAYAENLELEGVRFFGRIVEGVDSFFAAADVFVLPGLGGLAFNQAMYWRTPCIGSEADGTEDDLVIDGKTGFRFEQGDQESLQTVMLDAIRLPRAQLAEMGAEARKVIVERSNVNQMVAVFNRALEELDFPGSGRAQNSSRS
ncbi:MAG: glycosyltransferase family 4 protein [Pseudomonadota bacterium]|nr:glycosyltransferase family 4 protein [Pseudomonadota bacterium]